MNDKSKHTHKDLKDPDRRSYILRLWRSDGSGGDNWQASLESPDTSERLGFASLEELFAYLMDLQKFNSL